VALPWTNLNGARLVRVVAIGLMVIGLVVGIGVAWQWFGRVRHIAAEQGRLEKTLESQWTAGLTETTGAPTSRRVSRVRAVSAGTPIARLYLPTISQTLVVVEGAGEPQLDKGPGRMPSTTPLGQRGNTALAGHRYPGVFWNLDRVEAGDPVVVETADSWLVYRTVRTVIVQPVDEAVLAPSAGEGPTILTLITCEPKLSTSQRLIKQAELIRTDPKPGPAPKELGAKSRR
jgi:sortase A